jgi:hypothetical protein
VQRVEDRAQFDFQLSTPLPGRGRRPSAAEVASEGDDFAAFMAEHRSEAG